MRLLTNNPAKYGGLEGFGLEIVERVPLESAPNPENIDYLRTKRERMGHLLDGLDDRLLRPAANAPSSTAPVCASPWCAAASTTSSPTPLLDGARRRAGAARRRRASSPWSGCRAPSSCRWPPSGWRVGEYDAVICLGAVIRGDTGHYDHVAGECAAGIQRVQLDTGVPVVFGVLTTDTIEQAIERAGTKAGNKGFESAEAAIEMADLLRQLPKAGTDDAQLVLPKGSLERATLELFEAADLAVQPRRPTSTTRPPSTTRASTEVPSCGPRRSPATWPRAVRPRHHRPRLDRGDGAARSCPSASCTTPRPRPGRSAIVLAVADDSPVQSVADLPQRRAGLHRVPRADPPLLREARHQTPTIRLSLRRHRGQGRPTSPTPSSRSPRRAGPCGPPACGSSTPSSSASPS